MVQNILITGDVSPVNIVADLATTFDDYLRPSTVPKIVYQNTTPTFNFVINSGGVGASLTGLTVGFAAATSPMPLSTQIFNIQATITDPNNGLANATLTKTQTATTGDYIAELSVWGSNSKQIAIQFPLSVLPSMTS
jgi:BppU N-terminal domain